MLTIFPSIYTLNSFHTKAIRCCNQGICVFVEADCLLKLAVACRGFVARQVWEYRVQRFWPSLWEHCGNSWPGLGSMMLSETVAKMMLSRRAVVEQWWFWWFLCCKTHWVATKYWHVLTVLLIHCFDLLCHSSWFMHALETMVMIRRWIC